MARARPALAEAVREILERHGADGRRMSYRQAERLTGLSPATISELDKGNARTPETIRRFAQGLGEDISRLLLLAGFVPEEDENAGASARLFSPAPREEAAPVESEAEEREWLGRYGRALAKMPPGRERDLWKENLRRNTELLESFLTRLTQEIPDRMESMEESASDTEENHRTNREERDR